MEDNVHVQCYVTLYSVIENRMKTRKNNTRMDAKILLITKYSMVNI